MLVRGHSQEFAERLCHQIEGFESTVSPSHMLQALHYLVYLSAWDQRHLPAAFYCGLLNAQPMGFYTPSQLLQDAKRHGIDIRPIDVNALNGYQHLRMRKGLHVLD